MDEPIRKLPHVEKVKEHQEPLSTLTNQSVKSRNATHGDRSPKPKEEEKLRERLTNPKHVWRKESMEKRSRSGPLVGKHSLKKGGELRVDTSRSYSTLPKGSNLRPTSPNYESAFKRQVVNRPVSPSTTTSRRIPFTGSFGKGRRPPSPHIAANPEELLKKRLEKAKKAKLYLLQQAGPNSFIIGGGDSGEHRHKVTIGNQSCTCGKGRHCIHILFVMVRVFQLSDQDPLMQSKVLRNFEVESLFRTYETRRKERLKKTGKAAVSAASPAESSPACEELSGHDVDLAFLPSSKRILSSGRYNQCNQHGEEMEVNCPICLLDLESSQQMVCCDHCHNRLHHDCMAIWHQLVKKQREQLTCPLCRASWTSTSSLRFEDLPDERRGAGSTDTITASPNNLGVSPVSGFTDIEPRTLLPRSQPIPSEFTNSTIHWIEMFGEDLIGCLFMKNEWVMRETALRHLSREIVMLLSHPSEQDITSTAASQSAGDSQQIPNSRSSQSQSRIESVLEISCQILAMMMTDPVYKVYVASLRSLRTMLSYCSLPDVTKLREYMRPVIKSIILKCADGNRKTNQLSISTLDEFAKDQDGELAIGKELNIQGQTGLGGCKYVVECCVSPDSTDNVQIQWLNGRLLIMTQLLEEFPSKFTIMDTSSTHDVSHQLFSMMAFAAKGIAKSGIQPRTLKYSKRVILQCSKYLSVQPGMTSKIRALLSHIEPDMRGKLEKKIVEMSMAAQQAAIENINSQSADGSHSTSEIRAGSPHSATKRKKVARSLTFGSIYSSHPMPSRLPRPDNMMLPVLRRSDSYTEAVYDEENEEEPLTNPLLSGRESHSDSLESVEGDYVPTLRDRPGSEKESAAADGDDSVDGSCSLDVVDIGTLNDADRTLIGASALGLSSDSECEEVQLRKSPRKLSRSRVVKGIKPCISIRSENDYSEEEEVEDDGVTVPNEEINHATVDCVDGLPKRKTDTSSGVEVPPLLLSHESMGFETVDEWNDELEVTEHEAIEAIDSVSDSESGTDNISKSVTLSVGVESSDDAESLSDLQLSGVNSRSSNKKLPFKGYRRSKHTRSKTDPFKVEKERAGKKSPRYHSDPAYGDSTSSSSTPRSPAVFDSPASAMLTSAGVSESAVTVTEAASHVGVVQVVKPINRSLTFSEPPIKRRLPDRPLSMRARKGSNSQPTRSRLPARSRTAASVAPPSSTVGAGNSSSEHHLMSQSRMPDHSTFKSPAIPAAIRASSPPNSPLRSEHAKSSTPRHSPPLSPHRKQRQPLSPRLASRSPSPPAASNTAIVRPQTAAMVQTTVVDEGTGLVAAGALSPIEMSAANPSHPIQRQTSTINMIGISGSGSSDEHKNGNESMYVGDLSDSAMASPYEKPVSFKSEVALFSPRSSDGYGNCHCKDEVELEEAIALSKAMELSTNQAELPKVPGLSSRREEETITIHVQPDQTDGRGGQVEYLENVHWKRGMMLGTGAFSTCYQCRDVKTGIIMAVKQISFCRNSEREQDSICKAVIDEIRMMATLNHPNIVRILGATQTGAHFNMFVEWMPGGSVSHLLEKYGAFSEPVITSYTQQVFMGLAYLHDHHILHRDMKGANLLVDSTGKHLRIGDFGACAQLASSMTGAGELKGQLLGTIAFMAPEVLRGEHYGRACDVWSVGCVIIEMVTTKPPWNASNVSNHLKLIFTIASANASPPIPENLPPAIKDIMLRCLEPESKHRPPAKELLQHPLFTRSHYRRR